MDLQHIQEVIREYGVPTSTQEIVSIMREKRGVDVSSIINPPALNTTNGRLDVVVPAAENHTLLQDYYMTYRSERRMSRPRWYHYQGPGHPTSLMRSSSPIGIIGENIRNMQAVMSRRWRSFGIEGNFIPYHVVLDQNSRVDYDVTPPSTEQVERHIRVQVVNSSLKYGWNGNSYCFSTAAGENGIATSLINEEIDVVDMDLMRAHGWQLVYIPKYNSRGDLVSQHLIGAVLSEESDPLGTQAIVFGVARDPNVTSYFVGVMLAHLNSSRWNASDASEVEVATGPTEADLRLVSELRQVMAIGLQSSERIRILESAISQSRESAINHESGLANSLRAIEDSSRDLQALTADLPSRIVTQISAMYGVADAVSEMRPVDTASVETVDNQVKLKFKTYAYGMRRAGRFVKIPPLTYEVDLMKSRFDGAIQIASEGINHEVHPHLGGRNANGHHSVCWGNAGRRLAEAWARQDWSSLVRIILGWHTQYNSNSPLTTFSYVAEMQGYTPIGGWNTPEAMAGVESTEAAVVEEVAAPEVAAF